MKLVIWDTAGQEKYHALAKNYYQGASGALLVYDVTDADSFKRATKWYRELCEEIGADAPMIIAGNKCDIINQTVQKEEADAFARSKGITHLHTSAANGTNVEYIFTQLAESKSLGNLDREENIMPKLYSLAVEMMEKQAGSQPGARPGGAQPGAAGRVTKRNQLRVDGAQGFDPAGAGPVRLSRPSEKVVDKKKGGCCGGSKKD